MRPPPGVKKKDRAESKVQSPRSKEKNDLLHRNKTSKKNARHTLDLSGTNLSIDRPTALSTEKRATFASQPSDSDSLLPTFNQWRNGADTTSPRHAWTSSVHSPRGTPAAEKLTLGKSRTNNLIESLLGSMQGASEQEIKEALQKLERMEGSRAGLGQAAQEYKRQAAAARAEISTLQQRVLDLDARASLLENLNEGGTEECQGAIQRLKAELGRRAALQAPGDVLESAEGGDVDAKKVFGDATFSLEEVLQGLKVSVAELEVEARQKRGTVSIQKLPALELISATETVETEGVSHSKAERKAAEHAKKVGQLGELLTAEEQKLAKWQHKARELALSEASASNV